MSEAQEIRELINYLERRTASAEEVQAAVLIEKLQAKNAALRQHVAELEKDAARWRLASTSRSFGIVDFTEHGARWIYGELAESVIDRALLAAAEQGVKNGN